MNKYREAYSYIKHYCELDDDCVRWPLYQRNIKILKKAVEKAEKYDEKESPKKPLKNKYEYLTCPICIDEVENERGHVFKYCPNCGQRIEVE